MDSADFLCVAMFMFRLWHLKRKHQLNDIQSLHLFYFSETPPEIVLTIWKGSLMTRKIERKSVSLFSVACHKRNKFLIMIKVTRQHGDKLIALLLGAKGEKQVLH